MKRVIFVITVAVCIAVALAFMTTQWLITTQLEPYENNLLLERYDQDVSVWIEKLRGASGDDEKYIVGELRKRYGDDFRVRNTQAEGIGLAELQPFFPIVKFDGVLLWVPITKNRVVEIGPLRELAWLALLQPSVIAVIFFSFIAMAVAFALQPLRRSLIALSSQLQPSGEVQKQRNIVHDLRASVEAIKHKNKALKAASDISIENQRDFLHGVAHEFRGPLARLRFALAMPASTDIDPAEEILEDLDALVTEILEYSRFRHGQFDVLPERVDITKTLHNIAEANRALAYPIQISVHNNASLEADIDPKLVEIVVSNLVSNALRFASTQISLMATCAKHRLEISVADDGPGIPPSKRQLIYKPFIRLDPSRTRDTGGTGLGLSIVHGIMTRVGGEISVSDSKLGGALFTLSWPLVLPDSGRYRTNKSDLLPPADA